MGCCFCFVLGDVWSTFTFQVYEANSNGKETKFSSTIFIPPSLPCKFKKKRQESLLSQVIKFHKSKNKLINNNTCYIYIAVFQANTKISLLHPIMLTHFDTSASNKTVTL